MQDKEMQEHHRFREKAKISRAMAMSVAGVPKGLCTASVREGVSQFWRPGAAVLLYTSVWGQQVVQTKSLSDVWPHIFVLVGEQTAKWSGTTIE